MSEYDGIPVSPIYLEWLARGGDPAAGNMPLDVFLAWQGPRAVNADGTIQGTTGRVDPATGQVQFQLLDDAGLFGTFLEFAEIPAIFAAAAFGANAITGWLGAAAPAAAPAAVVGAAEEIAMLTGSGVATPGVAGGWTVSGASAALDLTQTAPVGSPVAPVSPGLLESLKGGAGKAVAGLGATGLSTLLGSGGGLNLEPQAQPVAQAGGSSSLILLLAAGAAVLLILKKAKP